MRRRERKQGKGKRKIQRKKKKGTTYVSDGCIWRWTMVQWSLHRGKYNKGFDKGTNGQERTPKAAPLCSLVFCSAVYAKQRERNKRKKNHGKDVVEGRSEKGGKKRVKRQEKGFCSSLFARRNAYTCALSLFFFRNVHPSKQVLRSNIPQQNPTITSSLHRQQRTGLYTCRQDDCKERNEYRLE